MSDVNVRKIVLLTDEIYHDGGPRLDKPLRRGAIAAVVKNPFAGRYEPDIMPYMEKLKPLGIEMSQRLIAAIGGHVEAYGKGTIVGAAGELEHGALWHVPGGYAMREVLGGAKAIVPSSTKMGGMGARIDIPLHHLNAAYVRSHFDAYEIGVTDGPKADEIVYILAMSSGGRPHYRVGGLLASEIKGEDGLR